MKHPDQSIVSGLRDWTPSELCTICALANDWGQAFGYAKQVLQLCGDNHLLPVGFSGWYETEALLRGGDGDLARAEVERLGKIVGNNKRYRLPLLRSLAVLAQWDGDGNQTISHLEAALVLGQEIGLPGEEWPILVVLGGLYAAQGEEEMAQQAYKDAAVIIHRLSEALNEEDLRTGFLVADPVQSVLELSEAV